MYPISNALRTRFENGERKCARITLNNASVADLIITEADIASDSLSIDRYCATGNKIEIGSAVSAELSLVLNNNDGRFDDIRFEGSELKVEIGIKDVANSYIPCGYFTVDEPPRAFSKISLKALDFMMRFDNEADLSLLPFPCNAETLVKKMGTLCGVNVSANINFANLPNSTEMLYAPTAPNITYRQILQWVALITGTCAYIDWNGELMLSWYKETSVNLTPALRYSGDILENDISITGVTLKTDGESFVSGTEDYALVIEGNELIKSGTEQSKADNVFNAVKGLKYRPYECSCIPMPYLYPLDKITYTDKDGNAISTVITNHTFGLNSVSAFAAQGETQQKKGYAAQKGITKKEVDMAIAEAMKGVDLTAEKFYVKYSPYNGGKDANGNIVWTDKVTDDTVYLGTCATTESTAPTDPTKYNWVRLRGVDGESISTVKNYYLATSSSSGITTGTSGWTEAVQTPTAAKKYLWNYEEIFYTGNKTATKTTPCIIGVFGADGKGIKTITEHYLASASSSGVTTGTTGWSTDMQLTTGTKKYLWNYETITYTDDSTSTTDPVVIGVHGEKGDTGVGISTVKNYYLASSSSSGVTTSTSGWSDNVSTQTLTSTKKYLWNYEEVTYTDSTLQPTKTDPCIIGVYGSDGKGISSVTEYYLATSSSSGVTTGTSGWTTAIQTVTSTKKYLWNYEVIAYTSGNPTTTTPVIIGTYGDKGDKGDPGKGISSVVNYYLASSSSSGVTTSTSGWTESIQTPTKDKKYLWNYEKVTYSDTTSNNTTPCIIGNFAEEGKEGISISSVTEYYARSSSSSTAPADSSFGTSVPTLDATYKYLWNYEKIEYTGGKAATTTPKCVIGVFGKDGTSQYVHVRYSANSNGSSMTSSPQSNTEYMGVCVTTSSTAPTSYTNYTWVKTKGEQGVGIPGTSSYTHIKYSNNGISFTDNDGEDLGSWIGILVDNTEADSLDFSKYKWKKFTEDVDEDLDELKTKTSSHDADIDDLNDSVSIWASKTYIESSAFEQYKEEVKTDFKVNAEDIEMKFTTTTEQIKNIDGDLQSKFEKVTKSISFNDNGISIGGGKNAMLLTVDNDNGIIFSKNGVPFGWWDGVDFHTGNIVVEVNERAQLGNFAFVPRSDGSLSFLKVDGSAGDSHTHKYVETVLTAATCTNTGVKTVLCTSCGDNNQVTIPALGHEYTSVVTPPTATAQGYTIHTCTRCGDSYKDNYTPATGGSSSGGSSSGSSGSGGDSSGDDETTYCTVYTAVSPTGAGSVTGAGTYEYGESIRPVATPSSDRYTIKGWIVKNNDTGEEIRDYENTAVSTIVIGVNFNMTITALFGETSGDILNDGDEIIEGGERLVNIPVQKVGVLFDFIPEHSGSYTFESLDQENLDPDGYIYSGDGTTLASDTSSGGFSITYDDFVEGTPYILGVRLYEGVGTVKVRINYNGSSGGSSGGDSGGSTGEEITLNIGPVASDLGTVSVNGNTPSSERKYYTFNVGQTVTVQFYPNSGERFNYWQKSTGDVLSYDNPYTFTVDSNTSNLYAV